jgi:heterokaryon incompatibility protein (HET)
MGLRRLPELGYQGAAGNGEIRTIIHSDTSESSQIPYQSEGSNTWMLLQPEDSEDLDYKWSLLAHDTCGNSWTFLPPDSSMRIQIVYRTHWAPHTSIDTKVDETLHKPKSPKSHICSRCESIISDLPEYIPDFPDGVGIAHIGLLDESEISACSFCRLMASIKPKGLKSKTTYILSATRWLAPRGWSPAQSHSSSILFGVTEQIDSWKDNSKNLQSPPERLYSREDGVDMFRSVLEVACPVAGTKDMDGRSYAFSARPAPGKLIDISLLSKWLEDCLSEHTDCNHQTTTPGLLVNPMAPALPIRLIDCETRHLVNSDTESAYIALSYVWGMPASIEKEFVNDSQLAQHLPQTIEDAITVTLSQKVKYLWIDRYCIDQKDAEEKHHQIANMHQIYRSARLTIIAAAGKDPNHGLPGIGKTERTQQRLTAKVGMYNLTSTAINPRTIVQESKWYSRAWTFQEAIFSRRVLIFTDQEACFECSTVTRWETLEVAQIYTKLPRIFFNLAPYRPYNPRIDNLIAEYSMRDLTFDADALNGILAVLRYFEQLVIPVYHYWGIPILHKESVPSFKSYTFGFLAGLCWNSRSPSRRRPQFPSWSWAGWTGSISFVRSEGPFRYNNFLHSRTQIDIDVDGMMIDFERFIALVAKGLDLPQPKSIRISAYIIRVLCKKQLPRSKVIVPINVTKSTEDDEFQVTENYEFQVTWNDNRRECEPTSSWVVTQEFKGLIIGESCKGIFVLIIARSPGQSKEGRQYGRVGEMTISSSSAGYMEVQDYATYESIELV